MGMQLERFEVKNEARGKAMRLATFNVNFGPITVNGFELIRHEDNTFISEPHRLYGNRTPKKKFSYVWFNNGKGKELQTEILKLAMAEYDRRQAPPPNVRRDPFGPFGPDNDDGLPF